MNKLRYYLLVALSGLAGAALLLVVKVGAKQVQASHTAPVPRYIASANSTTEQEFTCVAPMNDPWDSSTETWSDVRNLVASTLENAQGWQDVGAWQSWVDFQVFSSGCGGGDWEFALEDTNSWYYDVAIFFDADVTNNGCTTNACAIQRHIFVDPRTGQPAAERSVIRLSDFAIGEGSRPVNHELITA